MKKLFLLVLIFLVLKELRAVPWTSSQVVRYQELHYSMKFWAAQFIPFDQGYQLMDGTNSDGFCQGASVLFIHDLLNPARSLEQTLESLTVRAAIPGSLERRAIMRVQTNVDSLCTLHQTDAANISEMQNYYSSYFNLNMIAHSVFSVGEEYDLLANSTGGGSNDVALTTAITTSVDRTLQHLRDLFVANPVAAAMLDLSAYEAANGTLSHLAQDGHCVSVFRGVGGHIIYFDANVGIAIFPDFSHFESFLQVHFMNRVAALSTSPDVYHVIDYVETFTNTALAPNVGAVSTLCGDVASSSRSASSYVSLAGGDPNLILGAAAQNFIATHLDFCTRKMVFKNRNYETMSIQLELAYAVDVYFNLAAGEEFELDYDASSDLYTYNGHVVQGIDLDEGRAPVGAFDQHDNMEFSWTGNSTITYKPKNLFSAQVLIDNYKDLDNAQYRETIDPDGINGGSANAIISTYRLGAIQFVDISRWGTQKADMSLLKRIYFKNIDYPTLYNKRIRKASAWDGWWDIAPGTIVPLTYHGAGVVKHGGSVLQQIDLSNTADIAYAGGDEFDFSWHNAMEVNYRPYWDNAIPPVFTLIDFSTGAYGGYIDTDGFYGGEDQAYVKVHLIEGGEALSIELHRAVTVDARGTGSSRSTNNNSTVGTDNRQDLDQLTKIEESEVLVYPVPATEQVFIQSIASIESMELLDMRGARVATSFNIKDNSYNIASLPQGVYILNLFLATGEVSSHKIIKN